MSERIRKQRDGVVILNLHTSDPENDAKAGGTSILPGSAEGRERQRDLLANSPEAVDDAMHVALESSNAQYGAKMVAKADKARSGGCGPNTAKRSVSTQIAKMVQAEEVREDVLRQVRETETKDDDKRARRDFKELEKTI